VNNSGCFYESDILDLMINWQCTRK